MLPCPRPSMHAPCNVSKDFLLMVVLVYHTYGLYNLEEENLEKWWSQLTYPNSIWPILPRPLQDFQWLEFFAGTANCTRSMRRAGYLGAKFDILYCGGDMRKSRGRKTNWMDLLTPSGFALHGCKMIFLMSWCWYETFNSTSLEPFFPAF